jgi:hypothetical protein
MRYMTCVERRMSTPQQTVKLFLALLIPRSSLWQQCRFQTVALSQLLRFDPKRPLGCVDVRNPLFAGDKREYPKSAQGTVITLAPLLSYSPGRVKRPGRVRLTLDHRRCPMRIQQAVQLFEQIQATRVRPNTIKSYAPLLKKFAGLRGEGP